MCESGFLLCDAYGEVDIEETFIAQSRCDGEEFVALLGMSVDWG